MSPTRTALFLASLLGAFLIVGCDGRSIETSHDERASAGFDERNPEPGFDERNPAPGSGKRNPAPDSGRSASAPGSALLSWYPPRGRTDGSPLRGLAGYRVYFGKGANPGRYTLEITNPGQTSQFIDNLDKGTWYFAITAYDRQGRESRKSPRVSKTIG